MIEVLQLRVEKQSQTICQVNELKLQPGENLGVVGSNGSGKTTLLRVLAGLEENYTGKCSVSVGRLQLTYVHQQPFLFRGTVLSNVTYAQRNGTDPQQLLAALGIEHLVLRTTRSLSGGEIRRVALARALATGPKLLLLDEPLAELDPVASEKVCQVLSDLDDTTIIIASPTPLPKSLMTQSFTLSGNKEL